MDVKQLRWDTLTLVLGEQLGWTQKANLNWYNSARQLCAPNTWKPAVNYCDTHLAEMALPFPLHGAYVAKLLKDRPDAALIAEAYPMATWDMLAAKPRQRTVAMIEVLLEAKERNKC